MTNVRKLLLACATIALVACQQPIYKPVEIAQNDVCFRCKAPIVEKQYAAEFATKDRFVRKFDDIACMADYAQNKMKRTISAPSTSLTTRQRHGCPPKRPLS